MNAAIVNAVCGLLEDDPAEGRKLLAEVVGLAGPSRVIENCSTAAACAVLTDLLKRGEIKNATALLRMCGHLLTV